MAAGGGVMMMLGTSDGDPLDSERAGVGGEPVAE